MPFLGVRGAESPTLAVTHADVSRSGSAAARARPLDLAATCRVPIRPCMSTSQNPASSSSRRPSPEGTRHPARLTGEGSTTRAKVATTWNRPAHIRGGVPAGLATPRKGWGGWPATAAGAAARPAHPVRRPSVLPRKPPAEGNEPGPGRPPAGALVGVPAARHSRSLRSPSTASGVIGKGVRAFVVLM